MCIKMSCDYTYLYHSYVPVPTVLVVHAFNMKCVHMTKMVEIMLIDSISTNNSNNSI